MKIVLKILDILGALLASVLAPVLLTMLLISPFISSAVSVVNPQKLSDTITSIDYTELINANDEFKETVEEMGYDAELVNELMQSDTVSDVIELYANDISDMLCGTYTESSLTADSINAIVDENMDELITIARDLFEEAENATDEELKAVITDTVAQNLDTLVEKLPEVDALADQITGSLGSGVDMETVTSVYTFVSKQLITVMYLSIAAVAVLIMLLRIYRIKGFMWLGVIFTLGGIINMAMLFGVQSIIDVLTEDVLPAEISGMVTVLPDMLKASIMPYAIIYLIIGIVLIAAFILLRILFKKMKAEKLAAAENIAGDCSCGCAEIATADTPLQSGEDSNAEAADAANDNVTAETETKAE